MDPYKAPPQGLKAIFKQLRSIKDNDPLISASGTLHFNCCQNLESAYSTPSTEGLDILETAFNNFHSQSQAILPDQLGDAKAPTASFPVNEIPGR